MAGIDRWRSPAAIENLARRLWGEPADRGPFELRFGAHGSKSVSPEHGIWFDHEANEGGGYRDLYRLVHGSYPENGSYRSGFNIPWPMRRDLGEPVAWWDYHNDRGDVVGRVVRFEPPGRPPDEAGKPAKTFRQFRRNGPEWSPGVMGQKLPLYRLPSLLRAPDGSIVYLTEGEKHVDALREWGLVATTNAGGAKKFLPDHATALVGHTVVILGDNDKPGRDHVAAAINILRQAEVAAYVLELPNLPPKGDVIDWIAAGGTKDELERLTDAVIQSSQGVNEEIHTDEPPGAREAEPKTEAQVHAPLPLWYWRERELQKPESLLGNVVTNSSRTFIFGATGLGKTHLALAMAAGAASGKGFGRWPASRPCRVLFIDGEMPRDLLQERLLDVYSRETDEAAARAMDRNLLALSIEDFPEMQPLNTDDGRDFLLNLIDEIGGVDVVVFDNRMALTVGEMKEEQPWTDTLPLVMELTRRRIAQVWIDHTGVDATRGYGTKTKEWRFDNVIMVSKVDDATDVDLAFKVEFTKARRRRPDNRSEFEPQVLRLQDDKWVSDTTAPGASPDPPSALSDAAATLLHTLTNLDPKEFESIQPEPKMPLCKAVSRGKLRAVLIGQGWFPEHHLLSNIPGTGKLNDKGYTAENNALRSLKRKGKIGYNRVNVWLV